MEDVAERKDSVELRKLTQKVAAVQKRKQAVHKSSQAVIQYVFKAGGRRKQQSGKGKDRMTKAWDPCWGLVFSRCGFFPTLKHPLLTRFLYR